MRLEVLSLSFVVGISLVACGGESVEDRARMLKSQRTTPASSASTTADPYAPTSTSTAAPLMPSAAPSASASSTAPAPIPPG